MEIGIIGLDQNNDYIVEHLLQKTANNIIAYDPDRRLSAYTAEICKTVAEVFERAQVIFLSLKSPIDLSILIESSSSFIQKEQIFIDLTDTSPAMAQHVAAEIRSLGAHYIDCAVFGPDGFHGEFLFFAGGNSEAFQAVWPLIHCFAPDCRYLGLPGRGRVGKVLCGAMAARLSDVLDETAQIANALHINGQEFLESLGKFEEIVNPLARLKGEAPPLDRERLQGDVAMIEQMQSYFRGRKDGTTQG